MTPTIQIIDQAVRRASAGIGFAVGMDAGITGSVLRAAPLPAAV